MPKYRGYVCTFLDVEADHEDDAFEKMTVELLTRIRDSAVAISIWQTSDDQHAAAKE